MATAAGLHVLVLAAHPDDAELCAGGTIVKLVRQGYRVGIVDFTRGELGTRGSAEIRAEEARSASVVLGIHARENLGIPDGNIANNQENRLRLIRVVRAHRPHIILANPMRCRHPDHEHAARLSVESIYYAGLEKIETTDAVGRPQAPWRPKHLLHYMQTLPFEPSFVVDVSDEWDQRMEALRAFKSQFHQPDSDGDDPQTFISNPDFLEWVIARARAFGYQIGARYGEAFLYRNGPFGIDDLVATLGRGRDFA